MRASEFPACARKQLVTNCVLNADFLHFFSALALAMYSISFTLYMFAPCAQRCLSFGPVVRLLRPPLHRCYFAGRRFRANCAIWAAPRGQCRAQCVAPVVVAQHSPSPVRSFYNPVAFRPAAWTAGHHVRTSQFL
eukprot:EG_transcript_18544